MSRARELAKAGGVQQRIAGFSSHVGMSTFLAAVHMEDNLTVDGNIGVGGNLTVTGTTTFNGGTLNLGNAATDNVVFGGEVDSNIIPDDDNSFDLGSSSKEWKDLYVDGVAYLDSVESDGGSFGNIQVGETGDNEIDTESGNLTLDSAGGTVAVDDNLTVSGDATVTGGLVANGNVDLGDATSDTITATGRFDSDLVPSTDGARDLGTSALEWQDLFIDGTAKIDTLTVDENATITGSLTANGNVDLGDATGDTITATGRFDSDLVPSTDGARDLGASTLEWKDIFIDGTAHIDTLDVDENAAIIGTLDVNGSKLRVGVGNTDIIVNGDMRVTGIMSVGNGTVTIDETTVKTGSSNLHNVGIEIAGVNTLGADTPIGENATIFNNGNATFAGAITAASLDISGGVDVDGTTDLDTTNVVGTLTVTGDVAADNVTINGNTVSTSSGNLTLDSNGGTTTINDNAVISGNLTVNGTTTTINSTTVAIDDKNFQVATGAADDSAANGAGFTVESGDGNKTFNFEATGDNWGASENLNLASGKVYKINNTSVLSATTLGSGVVNSSLTTLGTISTGVWQGTAIANAYLANSTMSVGGVTLTLGGTDATPAFNLSDATNYPTSSLSGTITNAQLAGSIEGTKLENSGVSAGSYGGSSAIPVITVDAQGLVTSATTSSIDSTLIAQLNTSVACTDTGSNGLVTVTADGSTVAVFDQNLLTVTGSILPDANGTRDLGASGTRWANVYSSDLDLSNQAKGANSVDGTWGSYLIEEGEDHLFLTNRRSGKKFRFVLEEV